MPKNQEPATKVDVEEALNQPPEDGIGSRIRASRDARGLSQVALATRTKLVDPQGKGVSRTVLVSYEQGHFKPGSREIRVLCDALSVTPTWLIYGKDAANEAVQASMETVLKADFVAAIRLALAITTLKTHERSAFQSLVLSMAGRELGDMKLSALLTMAKYIAEPGLKLLQEEFDQVDLAKGTVAQSLDELVRAYSDGIWSNFGNRLKFSEDDDAVKGERLYPEPKT